MIGSRAAWLSSARSPGSTRTPDLTQFTAADRVRAFGYVIIAAIYFYIAQSIAIHSAGGLSTGPWFPLIERSILLFLLVLGYAAMALALSRQRDPIRSMGLVFRPGWRRE